MWVIKSNLQCSVESNGFTLVSLYLALWLVRKTRATFSTNQMQKLKPIATWSPAFSRALGSLFVFTWVFIGSERNFPFLWLAVVIPLVMVFRRSTEKCSTYSSLVPCCIFKLRNILWRLFKTTSIPFWIFKQANIPRKSSLTTISILCRFALCFPFPPFVSLQKFRSTMVHQGKSEFNLLIFSYLQMSH